MKRCARCAGFYENEHTCKDLVPKPKSLCQPDVAKVEPMAKVDVANVAKNESDMAKTTYRYRDVEKRRAYMRELMRKRYKKANGFDSPKA